MKTYTTKSNAFRAAKSAGYNKEQINLVEVGDQFSWEAKLVPTEIVCHPTPVFPRKNQSDFYNVGHHSFCPVCGSSEIYEGEAPKGEVINEEFIHGCHTCGWEIDLRKSSKKAVKAPSTTRGPITHKSEIENPCKTVWGIATDMKAANPSVKRAAVLATCVARGIAYYTARTQYQAFLQVQKEMAEREAKQAAKK